MYLYVINIIYLIFFIFIFLKDRRRLINGFLFFILLFLSGFSLVLLAHDTGSSLLFYLATIIAVILASFMVFGIFIIMITSFINATILIKREGRSLANFLSLLLGIGILLWLFFGTLSFKSIEITNIFSTFMLMLNTVIFYLIFIFSNFILSSFIYQIYHPISKQDYIIVLGSGLINGEEVSALLAGRINKAIEIYNRQLKRKKGAPILIMSGGQGNDEKIPEGQAMKEYALQQGIPEKYILVEDKSKNTYENMLFSKQLIEAREKDINKLHILFSTTNYHVFRAGIYAKRANLNAQGVGAKTKFYFWYNATLREYIAILMMNKKTHIICILVLLLLVCFVSLIMSNLDLLYWIAEKLSNL